MTKNFTFSTSDIFFFKKQKQNKTRIKMHKNFMLKIMHYFIILILFRMVNLDNTNYVNIVDNVIIMLIMLKQWRKFSNICYINVYSKICTKVCRKDVQKGETNYYSITMPKPFA